MTLETTVIVPRKGWLFIWSLRERIKSGAKFAVGYRDLHDAAILDPTEIDIVIKINGAWFPGKNQVALKTGFRKHQNLGGVGNLEGVHQGFQPAGFLIPAQFDLTFIHLFLEIGQNIISLTIAVLNGVLLKSVEGRSQYWA